MPSSPMLRVQARGLHRKVHLMHGKPVLGSSCIPKHLADATIYMITLASFFRMCSE